jgi:hypothetical protein
VPRTIVTGRRRTAAQPLRWQALAPPVVRDSGCVLTLPGPEDVALAEQLGAEAAVDANAPDQQSVEHQQADTVVSQQPGSELTDAPVAIGAAEDQVPERAVGGLQLELRAPGSRSARARGETSSSPQGGLLDWRGHAVANQPRSATFPSCCPRACCPTTPAATRARPTGLAHVPIPLISGRPGCWRGRALRCCRGLDLAALPSRRQSAATSARRGGGRCQPA